MDLFTQTLSKKQQLLKWITEQRRVKTSEVILWGTQNYCNRAERHARELAQEGKIWRMADDVKLRSKWAKCKEDIWSICDMDKKV